MASLVACDVCEQVESKSFDPDVLSHIKHLDISKYITDKSPTAIAYGGFSEVFRGQLQRDSDEHEHVGVAIKRLRFHVDESKVKKAGRFLISCKRYADSQEKRSNLRKKSTCGQSCVTQTSCHCWDLPSARKRAFPCSSLNGCVSAPLGRMYGIMT